MFESIQDYLSKVIDKDELVKNFSLCEEYQNANKEVKDKLDLLIEDIKSADTDEEIIKLLNPNTFSDLGIQPEPLKLLDLATRTNGGFIPLLDPAELAAFIDLWIEHNDEERLFRLAYNYNDLIFDKTKIENYYIKHNNSFYLNEMACNDLVGIHYNKIMEALLNNNQLDELKYFATNISDKTVNIRKVLDKIKELEN